MFLYEKVIYWSEEDQLFVAEVPDLPGCIAHGNTDTEALRHINDAIRLWLDTARKYGDPVPEPTRHQENIA